MFVRLAGKELGKSMSPQPWELVEMQIEIVAARERSRAINEQGLHQSGLLVTIRRCSKNCCINDKIPAISVSQTRSGFEPISRANALVQITENEKIIRSGSGLRNELDAE